MSIASEIARLQGVKSDILQAISDKGVSVPVGSALDDCPGLIASISGGGVGGTSFFKKGKYLLLGNLGLDVENKVFTPILLTSIAGGGCFAPLLNLYGFNKISIGIKFQKNSTGGSNSIISYQSASNDFNSGRIFRIKENLSNNRIKVELATGNSSWGRPETYFDGYNFGQDIKINVDIEKISNKYKFVLKINDIEKINTTINDFLNGFYTPTFFSEAFALPYRKPDYTDLFYNDRIYLEDTFMIVDDEKYFGL